MSSERRTLKGMNVLLFMTDQERAIQHFPPGWAARNLPGATRLAKYGLTFPRAFCNACMCSPSRATLMTGLFPAQHGVKWTLEPGLEPPTNPQQTMPTDLPNLATVMAAAGYATTYKGKFHLADPNGIETPDNVSQYGFEGWNPPDAGGNTAYYLFGGGYANNDGRYIDDDGPVMYGQQGILAYLKSNPAQDKPFFLVSSLVNPHDVLSYPNSAFAYGYTPSWLQGEIGLPATVHEDLSTKPNVQRQFLALTNLGFGALKKPQDQINYLNFYGNLMKASDAYLVEILDTLEDFGLLDNTLIIRTSDHGELGMTHGGMRQKSFNFYEETLRVPLVFSNPTLYPEPKVSEAMVSHVDFLPTMANLFDAPLSARADWQGKDYSSIILNPEAAPVQDYIVFTFDDYQSGQANGPYPGPLNHIKSIREEVYKLAKYYDPHHPEGPVQWEMYDLQCDPNETRNLADENYQRLPKEQAEFERLQAKLELVEETRLRPWEGDKRAAPPDASLISSVASSSTSS